MAYLQLRTMNRFTEIVGMAPGAALLGTGTGLNLPGRPEKRLPHSPGAEALDIRLATTLQRLEKRLLELERSKAPTGGIAVGAVDMTANPAGKPAKAEPEAEPMSQLGFLLSRGQSLLNVGKPQDALGCFEEALSLQPNHAETLVKKGIALEQLSGSEEALDCYNRAIASDASLTMAYLHKGGLYNRMERHGEALECYERALQIQERAQR